MNSDFIRLKQLEGELKLSQMNQSLGCSITSKELVFFKPHMTYHLFLHDIVSMVPLNRDGAPVTFYKDAAKQRPFFNSQTYKLVVKWGRIISRSGVVEKENMEFIVPISDKMLSYISQFSGLVLIK
jgi:hypothetical protein